MCRDREVADAAAPRRPIVYWSTLRADWRTADWRERAILVPITLIVAALAVLCATTRGVFRLVG